MNCHLSDIIEKKTIYAYPGSPFHISSCITTGIHSTIILTARLIFIANLMIGNDAPTPSDTNHTKDMYLILFWKLSCPLTILVLSPTNVPLLVTYSFPMQSLFIIDLTSSISRGQLHTVLYWLQLDLYRRTLTPEMFNAQFLWFKADYWLVCIYWQSHCIAKVKVWIV